MLVGEDLAETHACRGKVVVGTVADAGASLEEGLYLPGSGRRRQRRAWICGSGLGDWAMRLKRQPGGRGQREEKATDFQGANRLRTVFVTRFLAGFRQKKGRHIPAAPRSADAGAASRRLLPAVSRPCRNWNRRSAVVVVFERFEQANHLCGGRAFEFGVGGGDHGDLGHDGFDLGVANGLKRPLRRHWAR